MKYIVFLFYRYYNKGATIRIPYESAIFALLTLIFINVVSLMLLFAPQLSNAIFKGHTRIALYVYFTIGVAIGYYFLSKFIPKKDILNFVNVSKNVIFHGWILCFYIIISFSILMSLIILNRQ